MKNSHAHLPGSAMEAKHLLTRYSRKPPSIVQARPGLLLSAKSLWVCSQLDWVHLLAVIWKVRERIPACLYPLLYMSPRWHFSSTALEGSTLDFCSRLLGSDLWPGFRIWSHHENQTCMPGTRAGPGRVANAVRTKR